MTSMQSAAKVGALILVFAVLVIGAYNFLGSPLFSPKTDEYFAVFTDAAGVPSGARVLMAGVPVGVVKTVALASPTQARLTLELHKGTVVPTGSRVQIPGSLIGIGNAEIDIVPPVPTPAGDLSPGATLEGYKASPLDSLLPGGGKETIAQLNRTMVAVQKLLEDGAMKAHVTALMESTNKTMQDASVLAKSMTGLVDRMKGVVAENQLKISSALTSGQKAVADVRAVTFEFAKYAKSGKLQHNTDEILVSLNSAAKRADQLVASMNALVGDPTLQGNLKHTMGNVADMSDSGKVAANNAVEITKNGTVISQNAITLTEKANEIATKASGIEDQLKGVLDKVGGFFGGGRPKASPLAGLTYEMDLLRTNQPNYWRTDINFKLPMDDQTLDFGVYDALASNKLNIELGKSITKNLAYRYGIYASKAAGGVDYTFSPRLSLRSDLYNINNPYLDVMLGYEFGNGLLGWIGMDHVFNGNSALIGIGIKR